MEWNIILISEFERSSMIVKLTAIPDKRHSQMKLLVIVIGVCYIFIFQHYLYFHVS
jgi:hypothetical protein